MKKTIRLIALILSILTLLPATCSYNGYCADMDRVTRIIRTSFLATNIRHQFVKRLECINILSSAFSCC